MVAEERILEEAMAEEGSGRQAGSGWMTWAFWAAGVVLLLIELNAGMGYVEAGLQQNMGNVLGLIPAAGMITLKIVEQSIWHWGTLEVVLLAVPVGALGLLLVALGLAMNKHIGSARRQSAKQ
jgi:hypothetical protein